MVVVQHLIFYIYLKENCYKSVFCLILSALNSGTKHNEFQLGSSRLLKFATQSKRSDLKTDEIISLIQDLTNVSTYNFQSF